MTGLLTAMLFTKYKSGRLMTLPFSTRLAAVIIVPPLTALVVWVGMRPRK